MLGVTFTALTFGDAFAHLTLTGGAPFSISGDERSVGDAVVVVSGLLRTGRSFALVSENNFGRSGSS